MGHREAGSQRLELPNANQGKSFTTRTLPVEVSPKTGDVKFSVESTDTT